MTFIINISWLIFTIYKSSIIFIFLVKLLILNGGYMFQLNKTYICLKRVRLFMKRKFKRWLSTNNSTNINTTNNYLSPKKDQT
jgi:hypothetical protein